MLSEDALPGFSFKDQGRYEHWPATLPAGLHWSVPISTALSSDAWQQDAQHVQPLHIRGQLAAVSMFRITSKHHVLKLQLVQLQRHWAGRTSTAQPQDAATRILAPQTVETACMSIRKFFSTLVEVGAMQRAPGMAPRLEMLFSPSLMSLFYHNVSPKVGTRREYVRRLAGVMKHILQLVPQPPSATLVLTKMAAITSTSAAQEPLITNLLPQPQPQPHPTQSGPPPSPASVLKRVPWTDDVMVEDALPGFSFKDRGIYEHWPATLPAGLHWSAPISTALSSDAWQQDAPAVHAASSHQKGSRLEVSTASITTTHHVLKLQLVQMQRLWLRAGAPSTDQAHYSPVPPVSSDSVRLYCWTIRTFFSRLMGAGAMRVPGMVPRLELLFNGSLISLVYHSFDSRPMCRGIFMRTLTSVMMHILHLVPEPPAAHALLTKLATIRMQDASQLQSSANTALPQHQEVGPSELLHSYTITAEEGSHHGGGHSAAVPPAGVRWLCQVPGCSVRVPRTAMRAHVGAHILRGDTALHACGCCGGEGCTARKGKGKQPEVECQAGYAVKWRQGPCLTDRAACNNTLLQCPYCPGQVLVWKYGMQRHWEEQHAANGEDAGHWQMGEAESKFMDKLVKGLPALARPSSHCTS